LNDQAALLYERVPLAFLGLIVGPYLCHVVTKEHGVQLVRGLPLHTRQHVAVGVQSERDARVTQTFTDNLGVSSGDEEQCRVRMPEVIEA
jgi:hypothetical protein